MASANAQQPQSIATRGQTLLTKLRLPLIGLLVMCLGILFGNLMRSTDQGELLVSVVVVIALLLITFRRPLDSVVIWIVLMPFVETYIDIPMGKGIPDLSFSRFLIAFLGIVILAKGGVGQIKVARFGLTEVCIVGTVIGIVSAAPQSINPEPVGVVLMTITMHLTPLVMYYFAKTLVTNRRELERVLLAIALVGAISGAYAIYEHSTGNVLFLPKGQSADGLSVVRKALDIRMIRGIWGETGIMGRALAISIPITFYLFLENKGRQGRRLALAAMLFVEFYGIVVAMSRTPWYSLLIALFIMQLAYPKFRKVYLVILVVAAIGAWAAWDQLQESQVARRVDDKVSTLEGRQGLWQAGRAMWLAKPVQGWGFGRYEQESGRFRTDGYRANYNAIENDYLHILVSSGLIGFIPYLCVLLVPLVNSVRLFFKMRSPDWSGFITQKLLAVYWAVITCYVIGLYTAIETSSPLKLMVMAVAGAVVGTHEHELINPNPRVQPSSQALPAQ